MLERIIRGSVIILIASFVFSGCSSLSKEERQRSAQQKHLRKIRGDRLTEQKKIITDKNRAMATPPLPSSWATNVTLEPIESPAPSSTESSTPESTPANP